MATRLFRNPQYAIRVLYCVLFLILAGCAPAPTPTPFIAPFTRQLTATATITPVVVTPTPQAPQAPEPSATAGLLPEASPTAEESQPAESTTQPGTTPKTCTDSLVYIDDLNYPDGTQVTPGQIIEKQWRVKNSGTCDWTAGYSLRLVQGYLALGAEGDHVLTPAAAGADATITIKFTAPLDAGNYQTAWQAYTPEGIPFGDTIFMIIAVGQ